MADDGETIDYCDVQDVFGACNDLSTDGSFLDELLKSTHACTHTHTCNPPGPSNAPHTHTCIHTHTHLFAQQQQQTTDSFSQALESLKSPHFAEGVTLDAAKEAIDISAFLKKRPPGNREAVKKYREKKKAHTAYLEEQVLQLRCLNEQLLRRLQGHAALEAEVCRLRTLLAEFRGRIDGELGAAYQKNPSISQLQSEDYLLSSYNVPCKDVDMPCLHPVAGRDIQSATICDTSPSGPTAYSCEKAIPKCGSTQVTRKQKAPTRSPIIDVIDCLGDTG